MSPVQDLHPLLVDALGKSTSHDEAFLLWSENRAALSKSRMVMSVPGDAQPGMPAKRNFTGGGILRSLFTHDRLFFLDDTTISDMVQQNQAQIPISYTVMLDLNAVNYVTSLVKQRNSPVLSAMLEAMQHLTREELNYDITHYFFENAVEPMTDAKLARMHETLVAWKVFDTIDVDRLLLRSELASPLSQSELSSWASNMLEGYLKFIQSGAANMFDDLYDMSYAVLLKTTIIQLTMPQAQPSRKAIELLEFMHSQLGVMCLRELVLCCDFFIKGPGHARFFNGIQPTNSNLQKNLKNMAWDLLVMHRMALYPADLPTEGKRYFLTYLLTFDRGLTELFDIYSVRSILYKDGLERPIVFPAFDPCQYLQHPCGIPVTDMDKFFSPRALSVRHERAAAGTLDVKALISNLEVTLAVSQKRH